MPDATRWIGTALAFIRRRADNGAALRAFALLWIAAALAVGLVIIRNITIANDSNTTRYDTTFIFAPVRYFIPGLPAFVVVSLYWVQTLELNPLQLVLIGTVMEAAVFVSEVPTGVFADVFGRSPEQLGIRQVYDVAHNTAKVESHGKGRDARVHVNVCLHAGQVQMRASEVVGGDLMDVAAWAPEVELPGVTATQAMLDGLDLDAELLECAPALRRVARGASRTRSR